MPGLTNESLRWPIARRERRRARKKGASVWRRSSRTIRGNRNGRRMPTCQTSPRCAPDWGCPCLKVASLPARQQASSGSSSRAASHNVTNAVRSSEGMLGSPSHASAAAFAWRAQTSIISCSSPGDAALTRRARKHSTLCAIVLKWSSARKRYERQGILVKAEALERAEKECLDDAEIRKRRALREAERRAEQDEAFVLRFAKRIRQIFPSCPAHRAHAIAEHACRKYSDRVGRSAAAKRLDEEAVTWPSSLTCVTARPATTNCSRAAGTGAMPQPTRFATGSIASSTNGESLRL